MNLLELPNIVLIEIFEHLSYEEISKKRLVCGKIDRICQHILNGGFNKVIRQHGVIFKRIKALLPRRESERRNHCLARHADILTSIETRISMLSMTYTKYIDLNLCCFIPGRVLDEILRILRLISKTVKPLRPHEVLQELRDISSMAIEHFDEKIASTLKRSYHMYSSTSRLCNTEAGKSKISTFFTDYLDNKTNMLLLNSGSGSHSAPETTAVPTPPQNCTETLGEIMNWFQSSGQAGARSSNMERTESRMAATKKMTPPLLPPPPYKLIDENGNCRLIHLMKNDDLTRKSESDVQTTAPAAAPQLSIDINSSLKPCEQHGNCPEARATMTYFKKIEFEYKRGIVKMHRMQQIQTQQSRRLQQTLSAVAELNLQVVELRKRLEDVDAKNRELSATIKQIKSGESSESSVAVAGVSDASSAADSDAVVAAAITAVTTIVTATKQDRTTVGLCTLERKEDALMPNQENRPFADTTQQATKRSHHELSGNLLDSPMHTDAATSSNVSEDATVVTAKKAKI